MKRRDALAPLYLGATVSPIVVDTNSGDVMYEKPDLIIAVHNPKNLPVEPPVRCYLKGECFQYLKPNLSWFGPPPKNNTILKIINPSNAINFKEATQNSASPKNLTDVIFMNIINANNIVIHTAVLTEVVQYSTTTAAAVTSAPTKTLNAYQ